MTDLVKHNRMANAIRALAMDAVEKAKSGHPGLPMGTADVATVLFTRFLKFDPTETHWPDRDRFVLSAGHGSMLLYSVLHLLGFEDMTIEEIENFRQLDSKTPGHPENCHAAGIETTTGPLGQGLANAVGMAIARTADRRALRRRHRRPSHLCARLRRRPDGGHQPRGDLDRRPSAASQADRPLRRQPHLHRRSDVARPRTATSSPASKRPAGMRRGSTATIPTRSLRAIEAAHATDRPTLIACRTTIGFGAPTKAGTNAAHGSPLGPKRSPAPARRSAGNIRPSRSPPTSSTPGGSPD